tara:strand:- start:12621 stop:12998 length:378 start_codon:yes stop_codon:yes gene_type:complete
MDKENGQKHHKLLNSEIRKSITRLFKNYLGALEDIQYTHTIAVEKLRDKLSPEDLAILNYLNNDHYSLVRKRVLDSGNEAMRDLSDLLENFNISLNDNNDIDFGNPDKNLIIHSKTRNNIYEEEK